MPPKTLMTPDEVEAEVAERVKDGKMNPRTPEYRKNKNPGINKNIELTTEKPAITDAYVGTHEDS